MYFFSEALVSEKNIYTGLTGRRSQILGRFRRTKTRKNIHIIMRPETIYELQLIDYQQHFSLNEWAGIVCDCLAGPHVLLYRLTGQPLLRIPLT
jgi:hypothetical protein